MQANSPVAVPKHLRVVASLAHLLERLDHSTQHVDATQYRGVVRLLTTELERGRDDPALRELIKRFPAAAQVYENLCYAQAGLCLHSLEQSLGSETAAADIIRRVARQGRKGQTH